MIGAVIHGYRIDRALAEDKGGFGEVFFAVHTESGAEAVVKALKPAMSANREFVKRFFNEARAAASIHHPGIVAVHNVGYHEDRAYLLMEKLRGEDLETRLRRGPLPVDRALQFLRQAAGAIGAAHDRGIVHRDLKPANLFIVPDPDVVGGERVKVLDFGIAKLTHDAGTMKTQGVFGTPAYMAPEQCASAADVDARADLYALGCILYEMIGGRPPFGHGGIELIAAHLRDEPPPLRAVAPWAPVEVEAVVMKLLRKRREERHGSCAELIAALGSTQQGIPAGTPSGSMAAASAPTVSAAELARRSAPSTLGAAAGAHTSPSPARRGPWLVIGLVVLALGGGAVAAVIAFSGGSKPDPGAVVASAALVLDGGPAMPSPPAALPPAEPLPEDPPPAAPSIDASVAPASSAPSVDAGTPSRGTAKTVREGRVTITSIPVSKVILDGKPLGSTPQDVPVSPGSHTVTFVHPELGKKSVTVTVKAGETRSASVKFDTVTTVVEKPCPDQAGCLSADPAPACCAKYPKPVQELTKASIAAAMSRVKPAVGQCGSTYPDVKGTVKLKIVIAADGTITSTSVVQTPDHDLGACVEAAVRRATFEKSGSATVISYPFMFQ